MIKFESQNMATAKVLDLFLNPFPLLRQYNIYLSLLFLDRASEDKESRAAVHFRQRPEPNSEIGSRIKSESFGFIQNRGKMKSFLLAFVKIHI